MASLSGERATVLGVGPERFQAFSRQGLPQIIELDRGRFALEAGELAQVERALSCELVNNLHVSMMWRIALNELSPASDSGLSRRGQSADEPTQRHTARTS